MKQIIGSRFFAKTIRRAIRWRPFSTLESWAEKNRLKLTKKELFTTTEYGFSMMVSPSDWVSRRIFFQGEYDPAMTCFIRSALMKGDLAIDVGAQRGWFSLLMSTIVGETGKIISYEASPEVFSLLSNNIQINNFSNILAYNFAVWDRSGELTFVSHATASNAYVPSLVNNSGIGFVDRSNSSDEGQIKIPCVSLDEHVRYEKRCSLIKIDVEGSEPEVIQGAKKLIERDRPHILLELNKDRMSIEQMKNIIDFLNQANYEVACSLDYSLEDFKFTDFIKGQRNEINLYCRPAVHPK